MIYKLVAYEEVVKAGRNNELAKSLQSLKKGGSILVVFGPEGGLTDEEVEKLIGMWIYSLWTWTKNFTNRNSTIIFIISSFLSIRIIEVNY